MDLEEFQSFVSLPEAQRHALGAEWKGRYGVTEHSIEDLDEGMFLESDLGMDSIKIVEFMNSILDVIPVERREAFHTEVPMRSLMQMQTVGEVIRVLGDWSEPRPKTPRAEAVALESTVTEPSPRSKIESTATADTVEILHSHYSTDIRPYGHTSAIRRRRVRSRTTGWRF